VATDVLLMEVVLGMERTELTQDYIKSQLEYLPEDGIFIWKVDTNYKDKQKGNKAGGVDRTTGYERIAVGGRQYYTHRLVWLYLYGSFPTGLIDHINQCKIDNRVENLREIDKAGNARNAKRPKDNTSGEVGVCWCPRLNKWRVYASKDKKQYSGGHFSDFTLAKEARDALHTKLGFSPLHGSEV